MLHANFIALWFMEPELMLIKVHIAGIGIFNLVCSCHLELDPMTFIYELDLYFLMIYKMCENKLPMSRLSKVTVRQIQRQN